MALAVPTLPHQAMLELQVVSLRPAPASWTDAIAGVAERFMNARVCFYEGDGGAGVDPLTGEGSESGINVIWSGAARVQQLRTARQFTTQYEEGSVRPFRFQLGKGAGLPFLPQGVKARVIDAGVSGSGEMGPGDTHLELLAYVVDFAVNASHQAVKTVELHANMRAVEWTWALNADGTVRYL